MPAEWAPHERTWMAWPSAGYTLGRHRGGGRARRARTWAAVARAVSRFEPVTVVVDRADDEASPGDWLGERTSTVDRRRRSTTRGCATSGRPSCVGADGRARRGRLGVQRLGRPGVGDVGRGHPRRRRSSRRGPAPTRIAVRPGQRGRRHPRRRQGHGDDHRDGASRPGPQPRRNAESVETELKSFPRCRPSDLVAALG